MKLAAITLAATAGLAMASPVYDSIQNPQEHTYAPAAASTYTFDLSGIESWDGLGDPSNSTLSQYFWPGFMVTQISWDITVSTYGASWLSEATVSFENTNQTDGFFLTPGSGNDFPGTGTFSSGGPIDLLAEGLAFFLDGDGLLNLEFFESFDDVADSPDAIFLAGSNIKIYFLPTPGSLPVFGFAALAATRRRR